MIPGFTEESGPEMKIKIGVMSDTHLHKVTGGLREIVDRIFSDTDAIIHVGDYVSWDIVSFLEEKNFYGVHGNMDIPAVRDMLPAKRVLDLGGVRIGLIHGWGSSDGLEDRIFNEFQNVDVIVYGHSHRFANHVREGVLLFNPGTASGFASSGMHSVGILVVDEGIEGEIITFE